MKFDNEEGSDDEIGIFPIIAANCEGFEDSRLDKSLNSTYTRRNSLYLWSPGSMLSIRSVFWDSSFWGTLEKKDGLLE
ncbi:MAG: hypothetical protein WA421_12215 [Nitrososphaeraceae archaeon]